MRKSWKQQDKWVNIIIIIIIITSLLHRFTFLLTVVQGHKVVHVASATTVGELRTPTGCGVVCPPGVSWSTGTRVLRAFTNVYNEGIQCDGDRAYLTKLVLESSPHVTCKWGFRSAHSTTLLFTGEPIRIAATATIFEFLTLSSCCMEEVSWQTGLTVSDLRW